MRNSASARRDAGQPRPLRSITLPQDVPPNTVVVEEIDGTWRVVIPVGYPTRTFTSRDAAVAWARQFTRLFLNHWEIVEKPDTGQS